MVCMVFHRSYLNTGEMEEAKADSWAQVQPAPYTLSCFVKSKAAFMVLERWHICAHSTPKTARLPAVSFVCRRRQCTKSVVLAVCWLLLPVLLFVSQPAPEQSQVLMYKTLKWNRMFKTLKCWLQLLSVLFTLRLFHSSPVPGQLHGLLWPICKPIIICIQ